MEALRGEARRGKHRWLGCLFTVPLGCAAFLAGAVAVALLLVPLAGGKLLARAAEEDFRSSFRGQIDVEHARLPAFLSHQELSFELDDPSGRRVLEATLEAPALTPWSKAGEWGPVELRLGRVAIVVGPDGVTNIEQAFERRSDEPPGERSWRFSLEGIEKIDLVFSIEELSWRAGDASAPGFVLREASGLGKLEVGGVEDELTLAGSASPGAGEEPLAFELVLRGSLPALVHGTWIRREGSGDAELRLRLAAREVSAALVDALLSTGGEVERVFGPRLAPFSLRITEQPGAEPEIVLEVANESRRVLGPRAAPRILPLD